MTIGTFLGFGSYSFGISQKLSAHSRFARSLEDPAGFNRALRNINTRLGGPDHFPYGVPEKREEGMTIAFEPGPTDQSKDPHINKSSTAAGEPGEDWTGSAVQNEIDRNQAQQPDQSRVQRPPSKWEEIRAANNKSGSLSSWDIIRQNHERNRGIGADSTGDRHNSTDLDSSINKSEKQWDSRALDEAQFEAVLEAERRRASRV